MDKQINGILVINKPQNMTSHDVVAIVRKKLKTKKVGHTGTLDPMATGVLPICIGKGTKIVEFLVDGQKEYTCEMALGKATDTQDQWGEVTETSDYDHVTNAQFERAIQSFVGDILQTPPMYSALKVGGEKLVDLARRGIEVERSPRLRTIYSISDVSVSGNKGRFTVCCSKGTYIRTLCHDIGIKLGTYAHMTQLERNRSSPFGLKDAISISDFINLADEDVEAILFPIDHALIQLPQIAIPMDLSLDKKIKNGVRIDLTAYVKNDFDLSEPTYRVYYDGHFYGVAEKRSTGIFISKLMIG